MFNIYGRRYGSLPTPVLRPCRRLANSEHARKPSLVASNIRVRPQLETYNVAVRYAREKFARKHKIVVR